MRDGNGLQSEGALGTEGRLGADRQPVGDM